VLIYFSISLWIFFYRFSIATSAYIVVQFLKLSSQESSQDPMYYVLLRHPHKYVYKKTTIEYISLYIWYPFKEIPVFSLRFNGIGVTLTPIGIQLLLLFS
jgi:hypothetical protein